MALRPRWRRWRPVRVPTTVCTVSLLLLIHIYSTCPPPEGAATDAASQRQCVGPLLKTSPMAPSQRPRSVSHVRAGSAHAPHAPPGTDLFTEE